MRPAVSTATRRRLETQGYVGLDDRGLADLAPWVRVAPAIFTGWTAVGTVLGSAAALWALVPLAAVGVLAPRHPVDVLYERGIRALLDTPPMPTTAAPRRFAYGLVAVWLAAAALAFESGAERLGRGLGGALVVAEIVHAATLFCFASWLWVRAAALAHRRHRCRP